MLAEEIVLDGYEGLKSIVDVVKHVKRLVESLPLSDAMAKACSLYRGFPKVVRAIAEAYASGRLLDLEYRLDVELSLTESYRPPVRPALDPEFALTLRLYSLDHQEVGLFLGYPSCCMESFIGEGRMFFDREHERELEEVRRRGLKVVLTAGFIPCSLNCPNAVRAGLLAHLGDLSTIRRLDDELKKRLPHSHPAYQSFYEVLS
ncbi:MAG: hypothetical protein DRJ68_06095 [Thermoprotei archaeon]|nr:MAG: hypothetical protein DRJ62_06490 [Thermoprotei archaeon]RLF19294.1 MAG: hypothetical protein DRJ68_06095 [Thermoprotei archaeon]